MRISRSLLLLAAGLNILSTSSFADTVILKSGERIEGKIIGETPEQLTVEVKVSAGISDERVIPRADVVSLQKAAADAAAYQAVMRIQPGANSVTHAQYDAMIGALQGFLTQFPTSVHAGDARQTMTALAAEKKRVEAGEAKIAGRWMTKAEVAKERMQVGGTLAFEHMKAQSAGGDLTGALNSLAIIERTYGGARTLPDAIELGTKLIVSLKAAVERAIESQRIDKIEREKGYAASGPVQRAELVAAYQREQAQAEAAVTAAERIGKWPPYIPRGEKSVTVLKTKTASELTRLSALPVEKMRESLALTDRAAAEMKAGELDAAGESLKEATTLWPANELAKRLSGELAQAKVKTVPPAATPAPAETQKATPRPLPKGAAAPAPAPASVDGEEKPFFKTLGGAISIVVGLAAVLAGVNIFKKMKARASDAPPP